MSVFDQDTEKIQYELLEQLLNKYDINDVKIDENPDSHLRADRVLYAIGKLQNEVMELSEQRDEAVHFYTEAIEKKTKNMRYLEGMLEYFINNEDKKTIKLPNGTLKLRTTKKFEYPSDDVLLNFCKERDIPVVMTEKPNLSVVKKYIKTTGEEPEGMEVVEVTSFTYKTNREGQ
tara:strand:+ start:2510 stop:3034 length:525 start_codon:yes stop_codon:yes gene_type:complete